MNVERDLRKSIRAANSTDNTVKTVVESGTMTLEIFLEEDPRLALHSKEASSVGQYPTCGEAMNYRVVRAGHA